MPLVGVGSQGVGLGELLSALWPTTPLKAWLSVLWHFQNIHLSRWESRHHSLITANYIHRPRRSLPVICDWQLISGWGVDMKWILILCYKLIWLQTLCITVTVTRTKINHITVRCWTAKVWQTRCTLTVEHLFFVRFDSYLIFSI